MTVVHTAGEQPDALRLAATVIDGGYCVGCGACAAAAPDVLGMVVDDAGRWQARLLGDGTGSDVPVTALCPFGEDTADEDELARENLETSGLTYGTGLGFYADIWAGHAPEEYRSVGSSGGLASWFAAEMLARGEVDAVAHVLPTAGVREQPLFSYGLSRTAAEVRAGGRSHYATVEMSQVVREMREVQGRFLVVGLPCFVKAVRNLTRHDPVLRDRIVCTAAIFCGHLKSTAYGELLGWHMGVAPEDLQRISFREKLSDRPANRYATKVTDRRGAQTVRPSSDFRATNWGLGYFKFRACDFCDDISGETADISFGDAWLPRYVGDPAGTSLVITRSRALSAVLQHAADTGAVTLEAVTAGQALQSQDANFRHRREGLAYRLLQARRRARWTPPKRVAAAAGHLTRRERRRLDVRAELSALSHDAFRTHRAAGDLAGFEREMDPLVRRHERLTARHLPTVVMRRLRRALTARRRRRGFLSDPPTSP